MFTRLLIGFDGSPCSESAVRGLRYAGLPAAGEAVVLTAAEVPAHHFQWLARHRMADLICEETALRNASAVASRGLAMVREVLPGWDVSTEVSTNRAAEELVNRAAAWHVDLIVVGSHARFGVRRLLLGSVSDQVVKHAPCSVRVGHGGERKGRRGGGLRILVGVDGSEGGEAAVREVGARAWPPGTEVQTIAVLDTRMLVFAGEFPVIDIPPLTREECETTGERHEAVAAAGRLRKAGLSATAKVAAGDPVQVLLSEAAEWPADCIFIGAPGLPRLEQLLLGKIAGPVAAQADCAVEIVRAVSPAIRPDKKHALA